MLVEHGVEWSLGPACVDASLVRGTTKVRASRQAESSILA